MARQRYETQTDTDNERVIIDKALQHLFPGATAEKNPKAYEQIDFSIVRPRGEIVGFAEVKRRDCEFGQYPDFILSLHKWKELRLYGIVTLKPFFFILGLNDGVYAYQFNPEHEFRFEWGGRTSATRDDGDVEPVIRIPRFFFKKVGEAMKEMGL